MKIKTKKYDADIVYEPEMGGWIVFIDYSKSGGDSARITLWSFIKRYFKFP